MAEMRATGRSMRDIKNSEAYKNASGRQMEQSGTMPKSFKGGGRAFIEAVNRGEYRVVQRDRFGRPTKYAKVSPSRRRGGGGAGKKGKGAGTSGG